MLHAPVIREGLRVWFRPPLPSLRSSKPSSQSCLTTPWLPNQYQLLVQQETPPACHHLPYSSSSSSPPLPSFRSSPCFPHSRIHLRQGARARLLKAPDESATTAQLRQRWTRREGGRMKNGKKYIQTRGGTVVSEGPPIVVNNRQAVKTEDEGGVCVW